MPESLDKERVILNTAKVIAIVGLSDDETKDSNMVAKYLQKNGYKIIPVNPKYAEILGEKSYPDLRSIPEHVDIVDIFRKPDAIPEIVDQAIAIKADTVWMQLGLIDNESAKKAQQAGLNVVMDRCIKVEHKYLLKQGKT